MRPPSLALTAPRRALLGPADLEDHELGAFAAAGLGVGRAMVLTSSVEVFPYDRPAITTAGRYLVSGSARTGTGEVRAFSFVKVIHACLDPVYSALYHSLTELAAAGPPLLHQAWDDEHDPERFMETWISSIRALGSRSEPAPGPRHQARALRDAERRIRTLRWRSFDAALGAPIVQICNAASDAGLQTGLAMAIWGPARSRVGALAV